MKNALQIGIEFNGLLPAQQRPEYTEGYEGFYHLNQMRGGVESAELVYIVRDHDRTLFEQKKELMRRAADFINQMYGEGTLTLQLADSFYNMKEKIEPRMEIVENARRAMREMGIEPVTEAVRGGTDGSRLSFMGLPCPNLFTGGYNAHGRYEYISIPEMRRSAELVLRIATQ